jgi:hypothetical protein
LDRGLCESRNITMLWSDLKRRIERASRNFLIMRSDFAKDPRSIEFLSKSYLVLANRFVQVELDEVAHGLSRVAPEKPAFFKQTDLNQRFMDVCKELRELKVRSQRSGFQSYRQNHLKNRIERLMRQLEAFQVSQLDLADDLGVEIRFPTVNMPIIQRLKHHPLMDSSRTSMSLASIRVAVSSEMIAES